MGDIHELKADPTSFGDVYSGRKMAEVRLDDRGYKVGDVLHLREHQRSGLVGGKYTGRELRRRITHIQRGYGLPDGVVVLSLESRPTPEQSRETREQLLESARRVLKVLDDEASKRRQKYGSAIYSARDVDPDVYDIAKRIIDRAAMDRSAPGREG